jgi:hypothetical protein
MAQQQQQRAANFTFDSSLIGLGRALHDEFVANSPFPHVVIDDALPSSVLDDVLDEFPTPWSAPWEEFDKQTEVKLALNDTTQMGSATRNLLAEFNGQVFVEFLEELTGIRGLIPDPHLEGGGLHQIRPGGFLKVHADFNRHRRLQLDRRLNALVYLNRDWDESYGGALELWDQDMSRADKVVLPVFNRMVVFATTDFSYHGHPSPLTCPHDRTRRSIALYYYTNGRPADEVTDDHTTLFHKRPGETFRQRPIRDHVKRWVPPAIAEFVAGHRRTQATTNARPETSTVTQHPS